jgi:hypothetical protein
MNPPGAVKAYFMEKGHSPVYIMVFAVKNQALVHYTCLTR